MRFLIAFGVPEKSVFTRLFSVFATVMLANFQDLPRGNARNMCGIRLCTEKLYHTSRDLSSPKMKKAEKSCSIIRE